MELFLLIIVAGLVVWGAWVFNRMISLRNRRRAAWGDVDALLKRRADLIPNLVATVKGYTTHEQSTLQGVTEARVAVLSAGERPRDAGSRSAAESALSRRLQQLLAVVEAYPELKASSTFLSLQEELATTENGIAKARRYYNAVVRDYNTHRETFPNLILAGALGFVPGQFFAAEEDERAAPSLEGPSPE